MIKHLLFYVLILLLINCADKKLEIVHSIKRNYQIYREKYQYKDYVLESYIQHIISDSFFGRPEIEKIHRIKPNFIGTHFQCTIQAASNNQILLPIYSNYLNTLENIKK